MRQIATSVKKMPSTSENKHLDTRQVTKRGRGNQNLSKTCHQLLKISTWTLVKLLKEVGEGQSLSKTCHQLDA